MDKRMKIRGQYRSLLMEDDVHQYETPNGVTFVKVDAYVWYNYDNAKETLTTNQLAARCADEEISK
ncbi:MULTISPECIES: hypothetical protein [unclassified Paenibacillus]|uniref:hypothetical protein n=1 Tax=unclassified Paenibacillus TaxID=185978 RepID=UPI00096E99D8|nr:hypothetical protein [Paenibacillus sp. FSL H8-0259]OMF30996.1 hypothetical protein BK132_06080 [Paenibacillus sp. FSL H8-0259]